jgi:hypothetical protein
MGTLQLHVDPHRLGAHTTWAAQGVHLKDREGTQAQASCGVWLRWISHSPLRPPSGPQVQLPCGTKEAGKGDLGPPTGELVMPGTAFLAVSRGGVILQAGPSVLPLPPAVLGRAWILLGCDG